MKTCCQDVQEMKCTIVDIQERIIPLQTIDNTTLVVDAPVIIQGDTLSIGGAVISVENGIMDLPVRTLINQVPLQSTAFQDDIIMLPSNTLWNGYAPTIEQYFHFFSSSSSTFLSFSIQGYMVNGTTQTISTPISDLRGFPFIAPEDCVLTSFRLIYIVSPGSFGTPGDGYVSLDVLDTNLNPFFTGISYNIVAPSSNSRTLFESQFEYFLRKGDSVGVYVSGTAQFAGGISIYATLGYRVIPPSLLTSSPSFVMTKSFRTVPTRSHHHRFPFNHIRNLHQNSPVNFEDQLERKNRNHKDLYGRALTTQDYQSRSRIPQDGPLAKQDAVVHLLTGQKENGTFLEFSNNHKNTSQLVMEHGWVEVSMEDLPETVDYLSFDLEDPETTRHLFEEFFPLLEKHKFHVMTIRHDRDENVQSRTGNLLQIYHYVRIFQNMMMGTNVSEDWYVHPDLLEPATLHQIINHPENKENLPWTTCIEILLTILLQNINLET